MCDQLCSQCKIQPFSEAILLLLICVNVVHGVSGYLHELSDILHDCHGSLLQVAKLFRFHLHNSFWNVVFAEGFLEFLPGDILGIFRGLAVIIPPLSGCSN